MRVLVVNAGSSSLKLALLDGDELVAARQLAVPAGDDELGQALTDLGRPDAVGHRVVHGGPHYTQPARIDARVAADLRALAELAPLHQYACLAALEAVSGLLPGVPAVACFDTAFHASLPPAARTYALPRAWRERFPIRRYGFHGLSHAYAARRTARLLDRPAGDLRIVICHLGAGASLAAVRDGRSVDTTMGFTPLEGLVMATRSGSVDPGLLLWLADRLGRPEVGDGLEHASGLLGLSGTADMRELLTRDDDDARLAVDVYLHGLRAHVAAMAAALGGVDVLVFTGGVGERSAEIRARAADGLGFLGVAIDQRRNGTVTADAEISPPEAAVRALVIHAREDLEIAAGVERALSAP